MQKVARNVHACVRACSGDFHCRYVESAKAISCKIGISNLAHDKSSASS
jgi:hypothetical protein